MSRNEQLIQLRPVISLKTKASVELEEFQTITLRPILKYQNEVYFNLFKNYLKENKIALSTMNEGEQKSTLENILKQNLQFKNLLIGITVGLFTENEIQIYLNNKSASNKRIIGMLAERINSQLDKLLGMLT